jgi:ribose 5-phosphate isomerase A
MKGTQNMAKQAAAHAALGYISPGMKLGLGSGSTAEFFVQALAAKGKEMDIRASATSARTEMLAQSLGIALFPLAELAPLDLTIDGADELDANLTLIKGGGGALLREKIVATASRRMIVIADEQKVVPQLGRFPLPIEVVPFAWQITMLHIDERARRVGCAGAIARREKNDEPFITDNGNFILDCAFGKIPNTEVLAAVLGTIPGIVEHGLFLDLADTALIGGPEGVRVMKSPRRK